MLFSFFGFFIAAWNYNQLENYMVQRLYKQKKKDADLKNYERYYDRSDFMFVRKLDGPKEYFRDSCCSRFFCCKKCDRSRRSRSFVLAREQLSREINIVDIIKR